MCTPTGRVVYSDHKVAFEQMLHPQIPLINLCVANCCTIQAVVVRESPERQVSIFLALRLWQSRRKRIGQRRKLRLKIIFGETDGREVAERCARELEVGLRIQSVINSRASSNNRIGGHRIRESNSRRQIVSIN